MSRGGFIRAKNADGVSPAVLFIDRMLILARPSAVSSFAPNPVSGLPPSFVKRSAGTSTLALVSGTSNRFQFGASAEPKAGHRVAAARSTSRIDLIRCTIHWTVNDERHRKVSETGRPVSAHRRCERQTMILHRICSVVPETAGTSRKPAACFLHTGPGPASGTIG